MHSIPHRRKRLFYVLTSFILSSTLLAMAELDLIILSILRRPELTTHSLLTNVLHLHVMASFLSLLGIIHIPDTRSVAYRVAAISVGGLAFVAAMQRVIQELVLSGYYPTQYAIFSR